MDKQTDRQAINKHYNFSANRKRIMRRDTILEIRRLQGRQWPIFPTNLSIVVKKKGGMRKRKGKGV